MHPYTCAFEVLVPPDDDRTDLPSNAWSFALEQRIFGPRRLLVAFADRSGRFRALVHTDRTDPPELALACCVQGVCVDVEVALAFCDEEVAWGPPPPELADRFARARATCADAGVHLVDWFSCDDLLIRSSRLALDPAAAWWDIP